ncbi:uncharacterized protein LOC117338873 [Pecten maximus]|uniref:uncharacterized protein LOC117338873 n=1 Tax=Pecten maximus TaxID=6579 RepID=UPI00145810F5|nr:uncharacterized protein LOC117338873 [Pecten maximus]
MSILSCIYMLLQLLLLPFLILASAGSLATDYETTKLIDRPVDLETGQNLSRFLMTDENVKDLDQNISVNSPEERNDTKYETRGKLLHIPIDSQTLEPKQYPPRLLSTEKEENSRSLSKDMISMDNDELQEQFLDLNMRFPCGRYDRCRVGRNYCNVDTGRCEICNSDVCHGTNADSMCNFMCREFPSPGQSSTSSPVPMTTEVDHTKDCTSDTCAWKIPGIVLISIDAIVLVLAVAVAVKKYCCRRKNAVVTDRDKGKLELGRSFKINI